MHSRRLLPGWHDYDSTMSWFRRLTRAAEPPGRRLHDLEFLALVRAALEELAPGVTRGAELKGNSLLSPQGWAIGVSPSDHGGDHHYDLVALPDVSAQPDVPCFIDCVVAMTGDPRLAAGTWAETTGACLLELLDRRGRFADHAGPDHERGIEGMHMVASGAVGLGFDQAENVRLQKVLVEANVLHRIAGTFVADLDSPYFNGVKVYYGGRPGEMETEVRINGVRHELASEALAMLGLPEPTTFTAVRFYALLLPAPANGGEPTYPASRLQIDHAHGTTCACGDALDPQRPGFELSMPHLIAELSEEERRQRVRADAGAMIIADGVGNFLKVRLPVHLDDGRTVNFLVWAYLEAAVIDEYVRRVHEGTLGGFQFEGLFCNAVEPWGEKLLRAPVVLGGQRHNDDGSIRNTEVLNSSDPLLMRVLTESWPANLVLMADLQNPRQLW
jgi:hypothetical protein